MLNLGNIQAYLVEYGDPKSSVGVMTYVCKDYQVAMQFAAKYHGIIYDLYAVPHGAEAPGNSNSVRPTRAPA